MDEIHSDDPIGTDRKPLSSYVCDAIQRELDAQDEDEKALDHDSRFIRAVVDARRGSFEYAQQWAIDPLLFRKAVAERLPRG